MRRLLLIFTILLATLTAVAQPRQGKKKFDPKRFEAEMEQYIVTEAGLTPAESAAFFPVFKELMSKQRGLFGKMQAYRHVDLNDNAACRKAIKEMDEIDVQIKELQQQYHQKFFKVLSPSKVLRVIRAEEKFHRQQFKRMAGPKK